MTEKMTMEEMAQRILNISIKDAGHLKEWLEVSGRRWLIFDSRDLVDSLPFPEGIDDFMRVVACYREHRTKLPSGHYETQTDPTLGKAIDVPLMKHDLLEVEELDRVIRYCIRQITEKDSSWTLENPPM